MIQTPTKRLQTQLWRCWHCRISQDPCPCFKFKPKQPQCKIQDKTVLSEPSAEPNSVILAFTNLANLLKGSFAFALCTQVQCKTLLYDIMPPPLSDSAVIDNVGSKELDLETNTTSHHCLTMWSWFWTQGLGWVRGQMGTTFVQGGSTWFVWPLAEPRWHWWYVHETLELYHQSGS